jgi:hypothetical protein
MLVVGESVRACVWETKELGNPILPPSLPLKSGIQSLFVFQRLLF